MKTITKNIFIATLVFIGLSNVANAQALLKDLNLGSESSGPEKFVSANNIMYFVTTGGASYMHRVWKSDGTANGTVILKDSIIATPIGNVILPMVMSNTLYYVVNPNGNANLTDRASLWKSDGTTAGTVLIDSLVTNSPLSSGGAGHAQPRNYTVAGNKLFFQMGKGDGLELWVTDGSAGGVHQVIDLAPGSSGPSVLSGMLDAPMAAFNGKVYFRGTTTGMGNNELYVSDGTAAGTMLVKDINTGTASSDPGNWIVYNNELYFSANGGSSNGIWKTDGTATGTVFVAAGLFTHPTIFKNAIYFENANSIWKTDGTAAGTALAINAANSITGANADYLIASYYTSIPVAPYISYHYSRTDGTTADTITTNVGYGASFVVLNNKMYNNGVGNGLWGSDGTDAGSGQLATNISGSFFAFNGNLYYNGWGTGTGYELWWLDGGTTPTGISEFNEEQNVSVYPNPSSGIFTCTTSAKSAKIKIYNMVGANVYAHEISSGSIEINLSNQPEGVYFYQLIAENQTVKTGKIVLR